MIPYGRQEITDEDLRAVQACLESDYLTQGPIVPKFESAVANHVGAQHAVAVNSATSALHIACLALGLSKGDWLWTSPITFVASANCGIYCGARVDFVDVDPVSYNMCPVALEKKLTLAASVDKLPKIVVVVHLCGQPVDMARINELANCYKFKVIEDASHAIGAKFRNEFVGNCRYSDITVFSFHPVKIITTGEGGMALTNSEELAGMMEMLRSHGITRDAKRMTHDPDGPWYYQQVTLGFNYRMTELQAALGLSQLNRLDEYVAARHQVAQIYDHQLDGLPLVRPLQSPDSYSSFHLYVIRLQLSRIGKSHLDVFEALRQRGIGVNLHYIPVHTQPFYQEMGFKNGDFPEAERYYAEAISLPMFATLTSEQQDYVIKSLRECLSS